MPKIDMQKLRDRQEAIQKRGGGGNSLFIAMSDLKDNPKDIRILEPHPTMGGIYFLEVPVWWVGNQRIISPEVEGVEDFVQKFIDQEIKASGDKELLALLNAKSEGKMPKVKKSYEYWVPVLEFKFDVDRDGAIKGVYNDEGDFDAELIRKYIVDGGFKILQSNTSMIRTLNDIVTGRGGHLAVDTAKGFNITLTRSGTGMNTKYSALKAEVMPMVSDLCEPFDLLSFVKSMLYKKAYAYKILDNYFFGEELPERDDTAFKHLEIRKEFEEFFKARESSQVKEEAPKKRRAIEEDDEPAPAPAPAPKKRAIEEDDEPAPAPAPKKRAIEEDDEPAPAPRRREEPVSDRKRRLMEDLDD